MELSRSIAEKYKSHRREREKNQRSRKFGHKKLKHSTMGTQGLHYTLGAYASILSAILLAFFTKGAYPGVVGCLGIVGVVFAGLGVYASMKGFKERERNYITCRAGVSLGVLLLVFLFLVFIGGLS